MAMAKQRRKTPAKPKRAKDRLKLEIMKKMGLLEKVQCEGWGNLSAQECGQLGGVLSGALKERKGRSRDENTLGNPGRA